MELKKVSLEDLIKAAKEAQAKAESEADSKQIRSRTRSGPAKRGTVMLYGVYDFFSRHLGKSELEPCPVSGF